MDDIALLTRIREDAPDRSPEQVIRGRAALLRSIGEPSVRPARARRSWIWAGSAAVATCALAATFVIAGAPGTGGADPAAAAVLSSAASAARASADLAVGPGQFLQVRTDAVYALTGSTDADAEEMRRENDGDADGTPVTSILESEVSGLWIPADRSGDWVWVTCSRVPVTTFGVHSEALAAQQAEFEATMVPDARRVFPGGQVDAGYPFAGFRTDQQGMSDDFSGLPRDPEELLKWIYEANGNAGPSPEAEALVWIADTLRGGAVPAEIRSVMYDTAALIPGVTVTEEQATLNGRTGTAIGRDGENRYRQDIVIDPATGEFIGERQVLLEGVADMPAGTAISSTSVTSTVVDAVPAGTELCAG